MDYYAKSALMNLSLCLAIKAPSYSTVKNWFNQFNCERLALKDAVREGPPKTAVEPENIARPEIYVVTLVQKKVFECIFSVIK